MARHGLMPIVAPRPHYGRPCDRPERPPIFSGIQYRLPTAAVGELPPFRCAGLDHSPMERLKATEPPVRLRKAFIA